MITGFIGFIVGVLFTVTYAAWLILKLKRKNQYASAMYFEKEKYWRVNGKLAKIAEEIADIRSGRKPGAIKYVD